MFYLPIDAVFDDLRLQFGDKQNKTTKLSRLIPSNITSNWEEDSEILGDALSLYIDLITKPIGVIKAECRLWHMKLKSVSMDQRPDTALRALDFCNDTFSTILLVLHRMSTLPISAAQAKRMFSKTKH